MAVVGVLACAAPARRALRIQPTEAVSEDDARSRRSTLPQRVGVMTSPEALPIRERAARRRTRRSTRRIADQAAPRPDPAAGVRNARRPPRSCARSCTARNANSTPAFGSNCAGRVRKTQLRKRVVSSRPSSYSKGRCSDRSVEALACSQFLSAPRDSAPVWRCLSTGLSIPGSGEPT